METRILHHRAIIQSLLLDEKKYIICHIHIDENLLTLCLIKIKDLGYEGNNKLCPREMVNVRSVLEKEYPFILIDYVHNSFRTEIFD